jgi:hypothetical protein
MLKCILMVSGAAVLIAALSKDSFAQYGGMAPQMMPGQMMPAQMPSGAMMMPPPRQQYTQLHAPMYPCPMPNVPTYVGGTAYTNQAFAPHEMLYAHKYKSLYPPFYYKVHGKWWWTPFGMESHDKWELQGTEVKVKYSSSYPLFSGFHPPVSLRKW